MSQPGHEFDESGNATHALFKILRKVGAKPTLYGKPISESELRSACHDSLVRRLSGEK